MRDHIDDSDWPRLARYLSGESSLEERRDVEQWIAADPTRAATVADLRTAWDAASPLDAPYNIADAWDELVRRKAARQAADPISGAAAHSYSGVQRVDSAGRVRYNTPAHSRPRIAPMSVHHHGRWIAGLAAAVVLGAGMLMAHKRTASPTRVAAAHAVLHTYTTSRGQRAEVELADGTHVILAPETTLRTFGDTSRGGKPFGAVGSRDVALDGEAYFEVVHDARHPFAVRTSSGIARDLGTKFVVSSYPEVRGMQVAVQSGAVAVHRGDRSTDATSRPVDSAPLVTLLHGDVARLDTSGTVTLARGVDVAKYVAWTRGSLVFDGTTLRDVARALSRWYDLDITLSNDAIADRHLSLTIDSESPNAALKLVALSLELGIERHGRQVVFHPL